MFIVKIWAGFANQMFQYAFYKSLLSNGKIALVDNNSFIPKWDFENVNLKEIFPNIELNIADPLLIEMFNSRKVDAFSKIKRRLLKAINQSEETPQHYIKEPKFTYNSFIYYLEGDYYLEGFWQTEKYFQNIKDKIRKDFLFKPFSDKKNIEFEKVIRETNAVAIHVRKGADYKKSITSGTCGIEYYKAAIKFVMEKINNPNFIIFSDNITWCKENLSFCEPTFVDWNPHSGYGNHFDMQLMSLCKHNIIANSSYSWWGAWLNNNPDKIIIAPKTWFNKKYCSYDTRDLVPNTWIKL